MFGRNVITVRVLIDGGEVILAVILAWVFLFPKLVSIRSARPSIEEYITYAKIAVVAFAGTSAFSIALLKSSFTLCPSMGRVHVSVLVAYLRVMVLPPLVMFLIKALLMIWFDILCGRWIIVQRSGGL